MVGRVPHCEGGLRVESWGTTFPFGAPYLDLRPGPCEKGLWTLNQVYQTKDFHQAKFVSIQS